MEKSGWMVSDEPSYLAALMHSDEPLAVLSGGSLSRAALFRTASRPPGRIGRNGAVGFVGCGRVVRFGGTLAPVVR